MLPDLSPVVDFSCPDETPEQFADWLEHELARRGPLDRRGLHLAERAHDLGIERDHYRGLFLMAIAKIAEQRQRIAALEARRPPV
jgi:hypothetical protein